jgi:CBS domain-containing protein
VLTRDALISALQRTGGQTPVIEIMQRDVATVPENACVETILPLLQRGGRRVVGVVDGQGRFVGYITADNLAELIMIETSRASGPAAPLPKQPAATGSTQA